MLTLQARVTLIAYVILMVAFFIPLKGDMDLLNKFGTSLIMLLPVSLSVYIINCMVTGSKAKLGLGCNAIAWIESLYILIIAVIVLLYNLMNSKKDTIISVIPNSSDNLLNKNILELFIIFFISI